MRNRKLLKADTVFDELTVKGNKIAPKEEYRQHKPFNFLGLKFNPHYSSLNSDLRYYKTNIENLFIKLTEDKIELNNSIANFLNKHNAYDLTLSQTEAVTNQIAEFAELQTNELYLKKLAIGFTIPTAIDPLEIVNRYRFHKGTTLTPMQKNGRIFGGKFVHTHYELKAYSKALEQNLRYRRKFDNENLLRIELVLKRPVIPKEVGTLADLAKPEKWQMLFQFFLQQYDSITKLPLIEYTKLPPKELAKQIANEEPRYWNYLKAHNQQTYKTYRKRFKEESRTGDNTIHNEVKASICSQFIALLKNEFVPSFMPCSLPEKRGQKQLGKTQKV